MKFHLYNNEIYDRRKKLVEIGIGSEVFNLIDGCQDV